MGWLCKLIGAWINIIITRWARDRHKGRDVTMSSKITELQEPWRGWRYHSGTAVYVEHFREGRLIVAELQATGIPIKMPAMRMRIRWHLTSRWMASRCISAGIWR